MKNEDRCFPGLNVQDGLLIHKNNFISFSISAKILIEYIPFVKLENYSE